MIRLQKLEKPAIGGGCRGPSPFFIWNILQRGTYEQKYFRLYLKLFYFLRFLRTIQPIHPIKQNHNWHVYYNHKKRNFHTKFFHRPGGYTSHVPASSLIVSNEKSVDFAKSLAYNDIKAESLLRNLRSVMHNTKGGMPT